MEKNDESEGRRPSKIDLNNLSLPELTTYFTERGEKPFRARQVSKWLYKVGAKDFAEMTDLSKALRERLAEETEIGWPVCLQKSESQDGTVKFLWELSDGARIESVLIPERDHLTLCISSQVGCAMGCRFCRTAELGFKRNLTQSEIIGQVLGARDSLSPNQNLSNLVFMGMGEPLANSENVLRALKILMEPGLIGFAKRHISLSTVGLVTELPRLAESVDIGLTVSLNAPDNDIRNRLMPINKRFPMDVLHQALAAFPLHKGRRITIAYVMLAGVNDSPACAQKLARFLHGLRVKVNLIPFNPYPGARFDRPDEETIENFMDILIKKHLTVMVRKSKGRDVNAACGQLAGKNDAGHG